VPCHEQDIFDNVIVKRTTKSHKLQRPRPEAEQGARRRSARVPTASAPARSPQSAPRAGPPRSRTLMPHLDGLLPHRGHRTLRAELGTQLLSGQLCWLLPHCSALVASHCAAVRSFSHGMSPRHNTDTFTVATHRICTGLSADVHSLTVRSTQAPCDTAVRVPFSCAWSGEPTP
jgi:hypothetical protein